MCYEALLNRLINSFADWCLQGEGAHKAILVKLESLVLEVHRSTNGKSTSLGPTANLEKYLALEVLPLLMTFTDEMSAKSPTFSYWFSCLKALQVMLLNIRAEREGNWILHLQTFVSMMPYYFCCNHHNYARWGTSYILDMLDSLPQDVKAAFMSGEFSVHRPSTGFGAIWE